MFRDRAQQRRQPTINKLADLGNVVVTNETHICIDNRRTAAMLVVNEC